MSLYTLSIWFYFFPIIFFSYLEVSIAISFFFVSFRCRRDGGRRNDGDGAQYRVSPLSYGERVDFGRRRRCRRHHHPCLFGVPTVAVQLVGNVFSSNRVGQKRPLNKERKKNNCGKKENPSIDCINTGTCGSCDSREKNKKQKKRKNEGKIIIIKRASGGR